MILSIYDVLIRELLLMKKIHCLLLFTVKARKQNHVVVSNVLAQTIDNVDTVVRKAMQIYLYYWTLMPLNFTKSSETHPGPNAIVQLFRITQTKKREIHNS